MKINVQTHVKTDHSLKDVFGLFNKDMFYYLTQNAPVRPLRYDGDHVGAEIHLELTFPWKDLWVSEIIDRKLEDEECYFVDNGKKLPFNIKSWVHRHLVRKVDGGVVIEDSIEFESGNVFFDCFWWLSFLPQFVLRKGQYRSYIKECLG